MIRPQKPADEADRLDALRRYRILDTPSEQGFDDLVTIAAATCAMPIATVSLIDAERQWFKARLGLEERETPREFAFCAHAILTPEEPMVINDTRHDPRFAQNPLVTGPPGLYFYAGVPMITTDGHPVGTLCVMDRQPRELEPQQLRALEALARQASAMMELRRFGYEIRHHLEERAWYEKKLLQYQSELETQNADLVEQTRTDPLTGLSNRRAFAVVLDQAIACADDSGHPLYVAVMDIDHFKTINDLHGHAEGDRVLRALSDMLHSHHAARGRIARYGGEEFVVLLPDTTEVGARLQAEFMRQSIAALPLGLPVTVSIGVAAYRRGDSVEQLITRADQALYEAKRLGRDRVVVAQ